MARHLRSTGRVLATVAAVALLVGACSTDPSSDPSGDPSSDAAGAADATPETTTTAPPPADCDPARPATPGATRETIQVDGYDREYALHVPTSYDGTSPAPLILSLHGFSSDIETQDQTTQLPELAGERGYVVVTPQGLPISIPSEAPVADQAQDFSGMPFWNFFGSSGVEFGAGATVPGIDVSQLGVDDVAFFDALLDSLESELCLDTDRIYVTGMSNGAGMTTTLGCELGDRLAAIAPVSGVNLTGACPGDDPVPVRAIHGDTDSVAAYTGNSLMGFELGNPSVPDRMAAWAEHNGCEPEPDVVDDGVVGIATWEGCDEDAAVQLWTIAGWGHAWPRAATPTDPGAIDATAVVLDFFDDHPRQ